MKVLIFGATRGVGAELTAQALARGHAVTAFARDPTKVLTGAATARGDVLDASAVELAVKNADADAILIALGGAGIMRRDFVCSQGTANIVAAMLSAKDAARARGATPKTPRVVLCSSMGVGDSAPHIAPFVRWILKHPLADKAPQEAALREAHVPLVVVRPTGLRDAPARGRAALAIVEGGKLPTTAVARADVAALMLDALASDEFLGRTVGVSWAAA